MAKILLVDDDEQLSKNVGRWLSFEKYLVDVESNGTEALARLRQCQYDVIILDWNLPGLSGPEVCKAFRAAGGNTPILMLTGRQSVEDKEAGLDYGADDYVTKPFHARELAARLRALLRRPLEHKGMLLTVGTVSLDPISRKVFSNGQLLKLQPKEFALLEFFMKHPNQVFSADLLMSRLWSSDSEASTDTVRTCVKNLRRKLDLEGLPGNISTIHGVGYIMDPD